MEVTLVYVSVKAEFLNEFKLACKENHEGSIHEQGNCRFDILQSKEQPTEFVLYESYDTVEAAAAHKDTSHYLAWREKVAPWMAKPRGGVGYFGLFPAASGAEKNSD